MAEGLGRGLAHAFRGAPDSGRGQPRGTRSLCCDRSAAPCDREAAGPLCQGGARRVPLELRGREGGGPSQLAAAAMHFEWSRKAKRWRWWASLVLVVDAAGGNDSCPLEVRRGRAMTREQK